MALYADRVKQSLGITGTGTVTLTLATTGTGYQSFLTAFGTGTQTVAYCIADQSGPNWEVGTGNYNGSANTLARTTVLASSNGGSLTNFSGGTQDVFCTAPAKHLDTFTSTNQGTVPASGGGTSNFLRADGTFAAPPAVTPASPTTSVQFNNAGAFGGSANFTYDTGTNTFTVGPAGATTTIETLAPTGSTVAGTLQIRGKNASAANGAGGGITLRGGSSLGTGIGGGIEIFGGQGVSGAGGGFRVVAGIGATGGGGFVLDAGSGATQGGGYSLNAGQCTGAAGAGGGFEMYAGGGAFASTGGDMIMGAGSSVTGAGGNFIFLPGGGATSGVIYFSDSLGHNVIQITDDLTNGQLGFFDAVPVTQPTTATAAATRAAVIGTVANVGDTYDGYTLAKVVKALRNLGILA